MFIQFQCIPVLAQSVEYYEGYNVITYEDGSKDIINGDFNFFRWDNVWRPNDELNISNGSWPYLYSANATTAEFMVDDTTLNIPIANTIFKKKQNSISQVLIFSKSELQEKEKYINLTNAFISIPYNLKSKKTKTKYEDKYNINYGRFNFKAGKDHITIHDDTLRDYIEDGEVFQDVTYLFEDDYDFIIENGEIRLKFKKKALEKLVGNIIIEINTWYVIGPNNWGGNDITFSQTTDVKATGNVELKQKVDDYKLYTRFDEGSGRTIHNENTGNVLTGNLEGSLTSNTWVTGKYGKAIYFNGIDSSNGNRVLFNNHPDIKLPGNFVISLFLYHTGYDNPDTDIMRKGSSSTASAWNKLEVGANLIPNTIYGFIEDPSSKVTLKDTTPDRRDGNWHFIALTRSGTTCTLMVDGVAVTTKPCSSNTANTAQLSIGAKDSSFPDDYIEGLIDEVRIYNRILTPTELTLIKNNEHFTAGTLTRNLSSIIQAGEELKELGCNGTWDRSIKKVDIMASTNNVNWDMIQLNAYPKVNYTVNTGNNYKYIRCSLSTNDASVTPIIESIRARISPSSTILPQLTIPPQPWNLQYTSGNYWVNHTWQAGTGVVTDAYNISVNGVWHNRTNSYYNDSAGASTWSNITVWAWNKSGSGNMSVFSVSQNIQAPSLLLIINGTIIDSVNKSGLAGVKVFTNTSLSTMTNATGFYSFEVTSGDYNITATLEPIYYPNSTAVSLMGDVAVQDIEILKKPTGNITGSVNS